MSAQKSESPAIQVRVGEVVTWLTLRMVEVSRELTKMLSSSSRYCTEFRCSQSHSPACQKKESVADTASVVAK